MTSRRKFLSNAFGIALVSATTWPIRADQARSTQGQSITRTSKANRRTTQKTSLRWDVLLAPSIAAITSDLPPGEKQRPWPPISSTLISGERDAVLVDAPLPSSRRELWRIGLRRTATSTASVSIDGQRARDSAYRIRFGKSLPDILRRLCGQYHCVARSAGHG